ncbi:MAG: hypothetical protein K0R52_1106 [Alphaproteobacteria bacterium]|jgi:oxalate decarboxylase/phosphoglucose isomerase-like protein (cupin superfamily)|nr:hypothetical protein [Alphaproteobacteria bacterium]
MHSLLRIQKINPLHAEITSPVCLNVLNNDKGRSVFLNSTKGVNTVAVLEFKPEGGIRGNHYHLSKSETLYIIDGKMTLYYWEPDKPEIKEIIVESGHLITIKASLGHAYKAIEPTLAFEMGTHPYNPADTVYDYRIKDESSL